MKKEKSVYWLREFKELIDQASDNSSAEPNTTNATIENGKKFIVGSSSKGDQSLDSDLLVKDESRPHLTVGSSAIDGNLELRHSTDSQAPPPQYMEDVLLKRLFSDEMQLSTGWSDSGDTSSDEDTSCELYASSSDDEVIENVYMSSVPCNGEDSCDEIYEEVVQVKRKARRRIVPLSEGQNGDLESPLENNGKGVMSASGECSSSIGEEDDILCERELCESVKRFFHMKVADTDNAEICQDVTFCECVLQRGVLRYLLLLIFFF